MSAITPQKHPFRAAPTRRHLLVAAAAACGKYALPCPAAAQSALPPAIDALTQTAPQTPPALTFRDVSNRRLTLADFPNQALVVNLWATWCGPCVAELPTFNAIATPLRAHNVLILPISIDLQGAAAVTPYFAAHGIRALPILLDTDGTDMQSLGVTGIPATIIINHAGEMVAHLVGAADWSTPQTVAYLRSLGRPVQKPGGFMPV